MCGSRTGRYKLRGCKKAGLARTPTPKAPSQTPLKGKSKTIVQYIILRLNCQQNNFYNILINQFRDSDILKIENLIADCADYTEEDSHEGTKKKLDRITGFTEISF